MPVAETSSQTPIVGVAERAVPVMSFGAFVASLNPLAASEVAAMDIKFRDPLALACVNGVVAL